jgi:hypothetical protein
MLRTPPYQSSHVEDRLPVDDRRTHMLGQVLWCGWRGRIRTFDLLIQSQAPYRLATRQWGGTDDTRPRPKQAAADRGNPV